MGQVWPETTNLPARQQSAPTQLHKNQVWVFGCQISQLLQRETWKESARGRGDAKHDPGAPEMVHPEGNIFQTLLSTCEWLDWGPARALRLLLGSTKQRACAQSARWTQLQDTTATLPKAAGPTSTTQLSHSEG